MSEINALNPPSPFIAVRGDGTDDSVLINTLFQNFDTVFLPPKRTYGISKTIVVPEGKTLLSHNGMANLKLLEKNIPAVELNHLSKVDNISVSLTQDNTSDLACGFRFRTSPYSARHFLGRVEVIGVDRTGNGVFISDTSGKIAFSVIENIYCQGVKNAIKIDMHASSYANGIIINNIVIRSSIRGFWLNGGTGMIANNIEWNTGAESVEVIYCNSENNQFNGFFYDLGSGLYTNLLATFDISAMNNVIRSSSYNGVWTIVDKSNTKLNYFNTVKTDIMDIVNMASYMPNVFLTASDFKKWGFWYRNKPYGGYQDNVLAYADKINSVTNTGKPLQSGSISTMFDPYHPTSINKPYWTLEKGEYIQFEIKINEPNNTSKRLDFLQIVFSATYEASYIKFDMHDGTNWLSLSEVTNNDKRFVVFHDTITAVAGTSNPSIIRVTISNPLNKNKGVKIEGFIGRMLSTAGFTFMPRNGGKIYGNLEFTGTNGNILQSPDGSRWKQTIDNSGLTTWTKL